MDERTTPAVQRVTKGVVSNIPEQARLDMGTELQNPGSDWAFK